MRYKEILSRNDQARSTTALKLEDDRKVVNFAILDTGSGKEHREFTLFRNTELKLPENPKEKKTVPSFEMKQKTKRMRDGDFVVIPPPKNPKEAGRPVGSPSN